MLPVQTWFQSMQSSRPSARRSQRRVPAAGPLRRRIGTALINLGLLVAADSRRVVVPNNGR
jgi:hypothetical protein